MKLESTEELFKRVGDLIEENEKLGKKRFSLEAYTNHESIINLSAAVSEMGYTITTTSELSGKDLNFLDADKIDEALRVLTVYLN